MLGSLEELRPLAKGDIPHFSRINGSYPDHGIFFAQTGMNRLGFPIKLIPPPCSDQYGLDGWLLFTRSFKGGCILGLIHKRDFELYQLN